MMRSVACVGLSVLLCGAAFAQSAEKPAAFDVADVHASRQSIFPEMAGGVLRGTRYELRNATVVDLIRTAYSTDAEKVLGGPNWLDSDRFDVIATTPAGTTPEGAKVMLQNLLADRFKLKIHNDDKPISVYVLSLGKGAPKLKDASGSGSGCQPKPQSPPAPGAVPLIEASCHGLTTAMLASNLRQMAGGYVDHAVVDMTKLEGSYDFDIKWTPRGALAAAGPDGISIFDAVDKQLGLKLELQKVSMPVIVVDNVNQKPTDNLPGVGQNQVEERVEFEAADVKPSAPGQRGLGIRYTQGGRIDATGSLRELIAASLEVPPNISKDVLVGAPKFADSAHFDIVAKAPSTGLGAPGRDGGRETAPPISVALKMLNALIVERFKLKTHAEEQPATVYALAVPNRESKLKKADGTERASCKPAPNAVPAGASGTPMIAYSCQNTTMAELARNLQLWAGGYVDHPIVDTTGLQGGWDFVLSWTPRGALDNPNPQRPPETAPGGAAAALDPGGISLFEAVQKQLGLKLEVSKQTIPVIVIDHVEEKPTEN